MNNLKNRQWQERFGWIYYNEDEIFRSDQQQIDNLVKKYADDGITILIGFSCTHFRWNHVLNWKEINECIGRLVKSCHKYGIRYVEHHSSHLTYNPIGQDQIDAVEKAFEFHGSSTKAWTGFYEYSQGDPLINGRKISSFRQISGATAKFARSNYRGYCMCFNNPQYKEEYFKYLESVYAQGVDGIMTDDVQYFGQGWWGDWSACTCVHCRKLFKEKTGYDIPEPDKWNEFYENYSNPAFVAWKKFKHESTTKFAHDVNKHFESLGYALLRPNYISTIVRENPTSYPFENCTDLWDFVFQENISLIVIKESFYDVATEAIHRFAMARHRGIPSMSMFYPRTEDSLYFSWGLCKIWGQLFTQCSRNFKGGMREYIYRNFEMKHKEFYEAPDKVSDLAFLLSADTRDFSIGYKDSMRRFATWLQASYAYGFMTDMVFESEDLDVYSKFKYIVAPSVKMLSEMMLEKLYKYVENGGNLIIIGSFAIYDDKGKSYGHRLEECFTKLPSTPGVKMIGKGSIFVIEDSECIDHYQNSVRVPNYMDEHALSNPTPDYVIDALKQTGGKTLDAIIQQKNIEATSSIQIIYSLFKHGVNAAIHIMNVDKAMSKENERVTLSTPIEGYTIGSKKAAQVDVSVKLGFTPKSIIACIPESDEEKEIHFIEANGRIHFSIPKNTFYGYCLIKVFG
ncbi:MAG: beta-galactosidase trimerization domain-containing protein [Clostridia bacterium]|nr:beta-galactosidase trimerization domain-containing protein [Clostridia bacterium]